MKKLWIFGGVIITIFFLYIFSYKDSGKEDGFIFKDKKLEVPSIEINHDEDKDGIKDLAELVEGARKEVKNKSTYKSAYYQGGYPPETEGVCTDVVWRAFQNAGYDLKKLVDADIKKNPSKYPRTEGKPDPNIDFRRVPNLDVFFKRHALVLTTTLKPGNVESLKEWQAGDIVTFGAPVFHVGIVSSERRSDGVPYIIHNAGPAPREEDAILYWHENVSKIIGHYRWPKI